MEYVIDLDKVNNSQDMLILFPLLLRKYNYTYNAELASGIEDLCKDVSNSHLRINARVTNDDMLRELANQMVRSMDAQLLEMIGGRR